MGVKIHADSRRRTFTFLPHMLYISFKGGGSVATLVPTPLLISLNTFFVLGIYECHVEEVLQLPHGNQPEFFSSHSGTRWRTSVRCYTSQDIPFILK